MVDKMLTVKLLENCLCGCQHHSVDSTVFFE